MCPFTLFFVQHDLLKTWFNTAAIAWFETDGGESFFKAGDSG